MKTDKENELDLVNCVQNNDKKFGNSFHDFDSDYSQRCGHGCGLKESDVIDSLKAELEKANNQKLNLLNDVRRVCYGIGINSPVRLRIQKMLDDFKDDESFLMNHNIQKFREVESLTKELEKARELIKLMKDNMVYIEPEYDELSIKANEFLRKEGTNE